MGVVFKNRTLRVLALAAVFAAVLLIIGGLQTKDGLAQSAPPGERPNFVFILTDDMDTSMLPHMPNVKSLMVDRGMSFDNAFVTNSLCCPSRATILRGQYSHNHGVHGNQGPLGGFQRFKDLGNEQSTVATWLQAGGYDTALFGKYLNLYGQDDPTYIPPGWDYWYSLNTAGYNDFVANDNGTRVRHASGYSTDMLSDKADAYVRRVSGGQKPFFMYMAPSAPHHPATPAARHANLFSDKTAPRYPSYDEADVSDKPQWIRDKARVTPVQTAEYDERYRDSLRSLQAVDEMVKRLTETLQSRGELDNTYIVFTSDNGFHMGQHRLPPGKWSAYEEDIKVPLVVRGPGISAGQTPDQLVLNNDFAPTFADLAGVSTPSFTDGRSLAPIFRSSSSTNWRSAFLQEAANSGYNATNPTAMNRPAYESVRTTRHLYVEYETGERELYDLQADPYQLNNRYASATSATLKPLQDQLAKLRGCSGQGCRDAENENNQPPPPTNDGSPPSAPGSLSLSSSQNGISLNWDDNRESDLAGYNVYRSNTDKGTYTKLNSSLLTSSAYTDADAPQGRDSYYRVTAVDRSGSESSPTSASSFREDTTGPDTTITAGPSGPTADATPTFTYSATDNVAPQEKLLYSYKVDNGAWSSYSANKSFTAGGTGGMSQGAHTFEVRAIDEKGNVESTPARREFTVDTAAPETSVGTLPSGSQGPSVTLSFSSNEAGSTFQCSMDNGPYSACSSPKSYTGLSSGNHVFRVKATDAAGNADASPAERSFTVVSDTTPPQTTVDPLPSGLQKDGTVSLSFSSNEANSTFKCSMDNGPYSACTSPKVYTGLSDGNHTFRVQATDAAGNVDATPAERSFTMDATAPQTTVDPLPSGAQRSNSVSLTFSSNEAGSTFQCSIDNGPYSACSSPKTYTGLADGSHTFKVQATDAAGNVDATPAERSWTVDTAAPQTTVDALPSGPQKGGSVTLSFSSNEAGSTFECSMDNGPYAACSSPKAYSGLSDGSHTFKVRATDAAGNVDSSPAERAFTMDATAPETVVGSLPSGAQRSNSVSLTFSSGEPGATFECSLDNGPYSACSSPKAYSGLSDGSHTFKVRATDAAGNVDATPAELTWTVDTAAPQTTVDALPSGPQKGGSVTLSFSSSEANSTFECSMDNGPYSACSSPKAYSGLSNGNHTFRVRATDAAGNVDSSPAERTFTMDATAPQTDTTPPSGTVSINNGASSTSDRKVRLNLSATDPSPGSGVEKMRFRNEDTGTWSSWDSYTSYKDWELSSGSGTKTVYVEYMDKAGNVSTTVQDSIRYSS